MARHMHLADGLPLERKHVQNPKYYNQFGKLICKMKDDGLYSLKVADNDIRISVFNLITEARRVQ